MNQLIPEVPSTCAFVQGSLASSQLHGLLKLHLTVWFQQHCGAMLASSGHFRNDSLTPQPFKNIITLGFQSPALFLKTKGKNNVLKI